MSFEPSTITIAYVYLILGLILLFKSADWLVGGAVSLAKRFGISQLLIGLTIVAMGTSAPEVAASVASSLSGMGDVALGNVFGSNIANLALIGGVCALIRPLRVKLSTLKREIPIMMVASLLLWPLLIDYELTFPDSAILLALFLAFTCYTIAIAFKQSKVKKLEDTAIKPKQDSEQPRVAITKEISLVLLGIVSMAIAAKITVGGGVFVGRHMGLSEAVIGMSVVAIGTSLPELVTCVVAALKGHDDISIGNLVGSNIFNTLLVTGVAGMVHPFTFDKQLCGSYFWIMIGAVALFVVLIWHKRELNKLKGLLLLAYYVFYMYIILGITIAK